MTGVSALAYVIVTGPVAQWRAFGTEVLGLQPADDTEDRLRFRTDDRAWRFEVREGGATGPESLVALGFEVLNEGVFEALIDQLTNMGTHVEEDSTLARERQVRRLAVLKDLDGNNIELVIGAASSKERFVSPSGVKFVCDELGVGHVLLNSKDGPASCAWYQDQLGFKMSDTMTVGPTEGYFMHCNPRHHTVALAPIPGPPPGLNHLMVEVTSLEDVGRALDVVNRRGDGLVLTLGEHSNDRMISFYVMTPSGFAIEYGTSGLLVDDAAWNVGHHNAPSLWGHAFNPAALEMTAPQSA